MLTDAVRQAVVGGAARNVILFLGDGMGDSEITLARNYAVGASGRLALDTLPSHGRVRHLLASRKTPNTEAAHGAGLFSVLRTKEQALMAAAYGTNAYHRSQEHTGTQVRIAAQGPQASNVVGVIDQTDLFRLMLRALEKTPITTSRP